MLRRALWVPAAWALLAAPAAAQLQNDVLDVFTVQLKPDKIGQFEAAVKKMVAANRQSKGSDWLAIEQAYGQGHTLRFITVRPNFAGIEGASQAFMAAISKTHGQAATEQMFREADSAMESARSELRRRRWELSANPPADAAAAARLVGEARYVQTTMVRARPGQARKVEELIRAIKATNEKATPKVTILVSQAVAGQTGTVYYISTFRKSLGEMDGDPPLAQLMGEEAYGTFLKGVSESVLTTESTIGRYRPELSNPAEPIAAMAPDFWRPKP